MTEWRLQTPVVLMAFNRPGTTARVLESIQRVNPRRLLVIADGPRSDHPEDAPACEAVRGLVAGIDWDCQVLKNYSDTNLGLKRRVSSGLNWVFETVEEAIILEDDCVAEPTFFHFCEELLVKYREDERLMAISGVNFQRSSDVLPYSYYFSTYTECWGWASWRRAWKYYDEQMTLWPAVRDNGLLAGVLDNPAAVQYWDKQLQATYEGKVNSWAYRWMLSCWLQSGLSILPEVNLVSNIGFSGEATNTQGRRSPLANWPTQPIAFPLRHPPYVLRDAAADAYTQKTSHQIHRLAPIKRVVKNGLRGLLKKARGRG